MSEGPKLTLPPKEKWSSERRSSLTGKSLLLGLAVALILGLQVYQLIKPQAETAPAAPAARSSSIPLKDVAVRLQRDNLPEAAARAYQEYLESAGLDDREEANILMEIGNELARAGKYEEALGNYFRASHNISEANRNALQRKIMECLQRLGKHAEQGYELADQIEPRPGGAQGKTAGDQDAGKVVAWIGTEKITASDLDYRISQEIEERAAAIPGLPPERVAELKAQAQKQFQSPQMKLMKLKEIVAREVLLREGLEREVDKSQRVQRRVRDFRRDAVVEEMVLSALRDRIKVSESDLRNFYRANPSRYQERASARVRIALLPDETKAREVIESAKTEDDFARLARENSLEPATKESGGLLEQPVIQGSPLPILGPAPELAAAIFQTEPSRVTPQPVKVGEAYAVAFVREKTPERTPPYEEVREQVGKDYMREKEAEVQAELVEELFEKHRAHILTEAFIPASTEKKDVEAKDKDKK